MEKTFNFEQWTWYKCTYLHVFFILVAIIIGLTKPFSFLNHQKSVKPYLVVKRDAENILRQLALAVVENVLLFRLFADDGPALLVDDKTAVIVRFVAGTAFFSRIKNTVL